MRKLGLKVWSVNMDYFEDAVRLYEEGKCDYIEVYVIPDSYSYANKWKEIKAPYVIHAPHYKDGVNLALKEKREYNQKIAEESKRFADVLGSDKIIFHPGAHGNLEEIIKQLKSVNDGRALIENKPYLGIGGKILFHGAAYEDIEAIMKGSEAGFCLDFGHAVCAANNFKIEPMEFLIKMNKLSPSMYHLTDGDYKGVIDRHDNYGSGTFPLKEMLKIIPDGAIVTNEASKKYKDSLSDFIADAENFRNIERQIIV